MFPAVARHRDGQPVRTSNLLVRLVGVYFQANGKFYGMGGRFSDAAGNEFTQPFEYDPGTNSWTTKSATYPDTQINNMACGVLTDAGTPYIYCVGVRKLPSPALSIAYSATILSLT